MLTNGTPDDELFTVSKTVRPFDIIGLTVFQTNGQMLDRN